MRAKSFCRRRVQCCLATHPNPLPSVFSSLSTWPSRRPYEWLSLGRSSIEDKHSPGAKFVFPILRGIAWLLFGFFGAPIRILNRACMPRTGSLLVISNHISNSDPVVVQYASPRLLHFLARRELFEMGLLGKFVRWWRAIPIKQSSADKGAIKTAVERLKAGEAVVIFPEGQLSPDGTLIELFSGTALIIRLAQTSCICVGLTGTNKFMPCPRTVPTWSFKAIEANWGEVKQFSKANTEEEIMGWIESELLRLTGQPPRPRPPQGEAP